MEDFLMEKIDLCINCKERPIHVKKRGLCKVCYGKFMYREGIDGNGGEHIKKIKYSREMEFVKNYFSHKNWVYELVVFRLDGKNYTPDFYDGERNVFIEVAGTRQAYHANKESYMEFRETFPSFPLEVRTPDGQLLDEENERLSWGTTQKEVRDI